MKKIFSVYLALIMCIGLSGCGETKEKYTPQESQTKLKDNGYEISLTNSREDSYFIAITKEDSYATKFGVLGFYLDDKLGFISYSNKEINSGVYIIGVDNPSDTSDYSKLEKEYAEEQKKDFENWLKNLNFSEEELIDLFKWYYEENK